MGGINNVSLLEIHFLSNTPPIASAQYESPFNPQATLYIPCGSLIAYSAAYNFAVNTVSFVEEYNNNLNVTTADSTTGTIEVLTTPDCTYPNAVIYGRPNIGYMFDHWSDSNTQNPRFLEQIYDTTIVGFLF